MGQNYGQTDGQGGKLIRLLDAPWRPFKTGV